MLLLGGRRGGGGPVGQTLRISIKRRDLLVGIPPKKKTKWEYSGALDSGHRNQFNLDYRNDEQGIQLVQADFASKGHSWGPVIVQEVGPGGVRIPDWIIGILPGIG